MDIVNVRITRFEHRNKFSGVFRFKGHWHFADIVDIRYGRYLYDTPYENIRNIRNEFEGE